MDDGAIEFRSRVLRTESREPVKLLNIDIERSEDLIKICSMCKKIAVSDKTWEEIESAVLFLNLFKKKQPPRLTHGLCPSCFDEVMAGFDQDRKK